MLVTEELRRVFGDVQASSPQPIPTDNAERPLTWHVAVAPRHLASASPGYTLVFEPVNGRLTAVVRR